MTASPKQNQRTRGEIQVWLTAAGLACGLLMIGGLLLLILSNGATVFWPKPITEYTVRAPDGSEKKVSGELIKTQLRRTADGQTKAEIQLFTGNKDAYGLGFRFIDREAIVGETLPADLIIAERMEYGDAIFYPVALKRKDGSTLAASDSQFQKALQDIVRDGNKLRARILNVEKVRIGKINARIKATELRIKELQSSGPAAESRIVSLRARIAEEQKSFEGLIAEARELRAQLDGNQLTYRLSSGEERSLKTGNIVFFYEPNRLSFGQKAGVFLHHVKEFVTAEPREANTEGGIFPAIFGTFVMTILLALLVTPFGVIAAIYLREYAAQGLLVRIVRICVNNLAGVPSIVFGVFGLGFFVYGMGSFIDGGAKVPLPPMWWALVATAFVLCLTVSLIFAVQSPSASSEANRPRSLAARLKPVVATSAVLLGVLTFFQCPYFHGFFNSSLPTPTFGTGGILWASLTLALMTLPVVIVATEEALAAVPRGVREAALACGASKWQTIQRVVLPSALPGVMTGVILAMARGAGEVAPLMITGVVKLAPSLPLDLDAPFIHAERKFMHLGFHIYDLGFQSPDSEAAKPMVFATTLLLILLVVVLNLAAISLRAHLRRKYQASAF